MGSRGSDTSRAVERNWGLEQEGRSAMARERLRTRYRPSRVRVLFVGEAPPASGLFFYRADSGLYRAIRDAFASALPIVDENDFLSSFKMLGCYLVDLCGKPVDRMPRRFRLKACRDGEVRLAKILKRLRPEIIVTVVRSIEPNVRCSVQVAGWAGEHLELPYPGRWHQHRAAFVRGIEPLLRKTFAKSKPSVRKAAAHQSV
jgi:hypothetical protein